MKSFWWALGAVHSTSPGIARFMRITGKKSVSLTAFWQLMITVGTAVKWFQTEEQVISQSYPEGSTFPIWTPMEKREFPLFKSLQRMCMRGKCNFFFFWEKKKLPFFYTLQSLVIFCMLTLKHHSCTALFWLKSGVPTAVCWIPNGQHCTSAIKSAPWVTPTFFYTDLTQNTTMIKVLFPLF